MDAHGGAAGEKLAAVKAKQLRPKAPGGVEGLPGLIEIAGGGQLGKVKGGQPRQLGDRERLSLVPRHMEAERFFVRVAPQDVVKRGGHGTTSKIFS